MIRLVDLDDVSDRVKWLRQCAMIAEARRRHTMTPTFKGIGERLKKLRHNLNDKAEKLDTAIGATEVRTEEVFAGAHASLATAHKSLEEVNQVLSEIEGTNSGGAHPLDDGQRSSAVAVRKVG